MGGGGGGRVCLRWGRVNKLAAGLMNKESGLRTKHVC